MLKNFKQLILINHIFPIILLCLLSTFILSVPITSYSFDKKEIRYLDVIKTYLDNISLHSPIDVYVGKTGEIYILDVGLNKILIFDRDLLPVSMIDRSNGLRYPISIAVNNKGMVYVSEETPGAKHNGQITIFDPLGRKKATIHFEGFSGTERFVAKDMAIDEEDNLYLAGGSSGPLVILSRDGKFISTIQPIEKTKEGKKIKADVTRVALKGDIIYLLSESQGHVYVYNLKGENIKIFGKKGGSPGKLSHAQGLTVDPIEGITYVMDYMRHTLLIYNPSGDFMNEFGGEGRGPGWFNYPKDICIDTQGRLFVADTFNKRLQVFQTRF